MRHILAKPVGTGSNNSFALWYQSGTLRGVAGSAGGQTSRLRAPWRPALGTGITSRTPATGTRRLFVNGNQIASNTPTPVALGYDPNPPLIGRGHRQPTAHERVASVCVTSWTARQQLHPRRVRRRCPVETTGNGPGERLAEVR